MRIESKLCHLSDNKAIVQVNGWLNDKRFGSALAEATTVELAEDKAIERLYKRLHLEKNNKNNTTNNDQRNIKNEQNIELAKSENIKTNKIQQEPNDWSSELTSIDQEIDRLNWSRNDEIIFLQKNMGYNSRSKITNYNELVNYLNILKKINVDNTSNIYKKEISSIIEESDIILRDLSWDNNKGREFLKKEFNVSTRKELDERQLISFVSKLRSIRNQYLSK
tara:strand:+ start:125 stop:793 length:669 start_codon:yes stop_codon:yes gene_type:complete